MADAPSGGGNGWGAFEVILALILGTGLVSTIFNKGKITPVIQTTPQDSVTVSDTSANSCGLSLTAPLSMQKVSTEVRVSGSTQGCNWNPDGTTLLFAQVVNSKGAPVSNFTTIQRVSDSGFLYDSFDTTIAINGAPTGTGYLILMPAKQLEKPITVRIPLSFVRK
jgi:hypothetical protein